MRKAGLIFILFSVTACLYARDFQMSWIDSMSNYIGEKTDKVPYPFTPAIDNGYAYVDKSKVGGVFGIGSRNIAKILFANQNKIVEYALWYMDSWFGPDETKELSDIQQECTNKFGSPKTENGEYVWTWVKDKGFLGIGVKIYEIGIYRASSDGSACVLIQKQRSGFEKRWKLLLETLGIK
jgi:hypothetical protein